MSIKMIVRYCLIEHIPIEQSPFHMTLREMGMEDVSDRLSYEVEVGLDGAGIEPCMTTFSKSSEHS